MSVKFGVVMDPIDTIDVYKDSTLAMLWAAADRGWLLYYMRPCDLYWTDGKPYAQAWPLQVFRSVKRYYQLADAQAIALDQLDVILMRKDPPVDAEYIYATHLLESAERLGVSVLNKPQSLRDCNEKLFATQFPECCPPLLVSCNIHLLKQFHKKHRDVIYKPLDAMGGTLVFRVKENDPNCNVIVETLTHHGTAMIMAQRYIPEIVDGDKRILLVDGEPVPYCLARIPNKGETRANLATGGVGKAQPLTKRDCWIAHQVAPVAKAKGLLLVGLDVIGDYLTEINVTSPTCLRQIDDQCGTDIGKQIIDAIPNS